MYKLCTKSYKLFIKMYSNFVRLAVFVIIFQQIKAISTENECMFQDTCERCLSTNTKCSWCTDKKYNARYRCLTSQQLQDFGCNDEYIYANDPQTHKIIDVPVKDYESVHDQAVQVQPQRVYMKLVKSHTERIKLTYRPARNNPLDLYMLMDLTWTMRDDKETLTKLGAELTETLHTLTDNYRLGFGSYADKPTMPMIMPHLRENPCATEHEVCEPTYSFRHHLALSDDIAEFVRSVNESKVTGNLDNLEGGLDALMQVLVCPKDIGWKDEARKVVLLVTDGFMHFAGDGLLAGIIRPNDKQCHLSESGEYLGSLEYDYPSLEEIYRELVRRKVNVIFAVTEGVVSTYHQMSNLMKEISNVEILSADSSNILELIKKSYESFIKRTQFNDNSPAYIKVDYETDCGGQFGGLRMRNYCNDLELGKEVEFYIDVTLSDYPTDGVYKHTIRIEESSLNEYMEIEVEVQKPCTCNEEVQSNDEYGMFQCSNNGYLHCGMCQCNEGWTGIFCNCNTDSSNATTNESIEKLCSQPFDSTADYGLVCSNRGECDCGTCFCFPGYIGKYCECLDCEDCDDPERAECHCGQCVCKNGWSGERCNCNESTDDCMEPTGEICSERGRCKCSACECEEPYYGKFCEIGSENENKLCTFYERCVICLIEQQQGTNVCENITNICSSVELNERFSYVFVTEEIDADVHCLARVENKHGLKCDHYFTYESLGKSENNLIIQVNDCQPPNLFALVGMIGFITFLLGFALILLIRLYIRYKDALEYKRFEDNQKFNVLMESPLYKDPMRYYEVPKELNEQSNGGAVIDPFK